MHFLWLSIEHRLYTFFGPSKSLTFDELPYNNCALSLLHTKIIIIIHQYP